MPLQQWVLHIFFVYPLGKSILIAIECYQHTVYGFMQIGAISVASGP